MAVIVSMFQPSAMGSPTAVGVGRCRVSETIAVDETTAIQGRKGEVAIILNTESTAILVAVGTTPDPDATEATDATDAAFPIAAGGFMPVTLVDGDKISATAAS